MNNLEPKIKRIRWTYEEKSQTIRESLQVIFALVALFLIEKAIDKWTYLAVNFLHHHGF